MEFFVSRDRSSNLRGRTTEKPESLIDRPPDDSTEVILECS
jgi:hypothetical protein